MDLSIFLCLCAVWLFCFEPIAGTRVDGKYSSANLLLARLSLAVSAALRVAWRCRAPAIAARRRLSNEPNANCGGLLAIIVSFVHSYRGVSILPRDAKLGSGWKSPKNVSCFLRTLSLLKLQADTSRIPSYSLQTALPTVSYRFSFPK